MTRQARYRFIQRLPGPEEFYEWLFWKTLSLAMRLVGVAGAMAVRARNASLLDRAKRLLEAE